jgi:hypothetical protein
VCSGCSGCSLQTAKKADPSYLERFAIFSREQQHAQKSAGGTGQATDLVSYVEFQRNYRLVMKVHKEALLSMRAFWMCLLQVWLGEAGTQMLVNACTGICTCALISPPLINLMVAASGQV